MQAIQSAASPVEFISDGVECEVLNPGQSWQKGKLKLCLVFYPDELKETRLEDNPQDNLEPESPLNSIRQLISEETQPV
ncbi:hypothetical protein IFO70_35200 [Phormidium tenue FACHB-886]|nr:hypothetical protein [Phormidium tenue FACHB-886]